MNKKEKQSLIEKLNWIRNVFDMPENELRQNYRWLEETDEINYAIRSGIVQAEINRLIDECNRGGI